MSIVQARSLIHIYWQKDGYELFFILNSQIVGDILDVYKRQSYFRSLEDRAQSLAEANSCPFVDNELPYGRAEPGHPVIVDYFYHEEIRGSEKMCIRDRNTAMR